MKKTATRAALTYAPIPTIDRLLSLEDVIATTALSRATVYRLMAAGTLKAAKIGRRRLVRQSDLAALIAAA